jgi:hypothetical protein
VVDEGIVGNAAVASAEVAAGCTISHYALAAVNHTLAIHQIVAINALLTNSRLAATNAFRLGAFRGTMQLVIAQNITSRAMFAGESILTKGAVRYGAGLSGAAV